MCVADWNVEFPLHIERRDTDRVSAFDKHYFDIVCRAMRKCTEEQEMAIAVAA